MTEMSRVQRAVSRLREFARGKDPASGAAHIVLDELTRLEALHGPPGPLPAPAEYLQACAAGCGHDVDVTEPHLAVTAQIERHDPPGYVVEAKDPQVQLFHLRCVHPAPRSPARPALARIPEDVKR